MKNHAPLLLAILVGALSGALGALWPKSEAGVQPAPLATATISPTSDVEAPFEASSPTAHPGTRLELSTFCQHRASPAEVLVRRLVEATSTRTWSAPAAPTRTDLEGHAVLILKPGLYLLTARAEGCGVLNQNLEVKQGLANQSIELQLAAGWAISGAVTDSTNQEPVAGALIQVQQLLGLRSRRQELTPVDERWTALTDSLGRYRVEGVGEGAFVLRVSAGGFGDGTAKVSLDGKDGHADLQLDGAGAIDGRVLHAQGAATVKVLGEAPATAFANADGSFHLSVPPGVHLLLGEDSTGATALSRVRVAAKQQVAGVELSLDPGGSIRGRATLGESPATCARVWVRAESDRWELASTQVNADGTFELSHLPPARYWLLAECPDGEHGDQLGVEPNHAPVELKLVQAAALSGQVQDAVGRAVAGAEVVVSRAGREPVVAVSDGQGHFSLDRLPAGVVRVDASAGARVALEQKVQLVEGQEVPVVIVLRATRAIRGRIEGAVTSVKQISAWSVADDRSFETQLDADGTFTLRVVPGHYRVVPWLVGSEGFALSKEVEVTEGQDAHADFLIPSTPLKPMETSAPGTIGASFDDGPGGVTLSWVIADSPVARAGLQVGDLLLAFDGKPVGRSLDAFALANGAPETTVRISYRRGGADREAVVTRAGN